MVTNDFNDLIIVESINYDGIKLFVQNDNEYPELQSHWIEPEYTFSKLHPIPLTEEWLIRMGAIDLDAVHYKQYRLGERLIIVRDGKFVDYGSSVTLEYVNTFQNVIYALTGEELTIKSN